MSKQGTVTDVNACNGSIKCVGFIFYVQLLKIKLFMYL